MENNRENRRKYRELLFRTQGLGEHISGAICYEETLFDNAEDGTPLVELLRAEGIIPGIKLDKGVAEIAGTDGETATQGIDGLKDRCMKAYEQGARFAKWRGVLRITDSGCPSDLCIQENVTRLARYASICQANGLVPIVEPEVLMDGPHTIEQAAAVTERVLAAQYKALSDHKVMLEGSLLKPNMVRHGTECSAAASIEDLARATVRVMQHTVPVSVPGIMFLSGGMSETEATEALQAINALEAKKPWSLTFSYGRALQHSVLQAWRGADENKEEAQRVLLKRARLNGEANLGKYTGEDGAAGAAGESLHVRNYAY